ncbi:phage major capsid protein [Paracoccus spongiarum]|uniref:Phage major capsid protein n=1 Tax=Paracoccus spongiarum TaxID=3064387 RepID=A0ABT9J988_9RHOB|nr:phage major capsid protein [Paracoccus sp. 2205BS29-5]MDP5306388.1 phage major capsid protein [Paracoccus sp. 2205BS29-5]
MQEQRSQAVAEMRRLADAVETRGDDYTAEEEKRHADLKKDITNLDAKIQRAKDIADIERSAPAVVSGRGDGAYEDRARDFSVTTAIRAAMGERVDDGRERELSTELKRRSARAFTGIAVPDEVFMEKRTLMTSGAAADLVPNVHRGDLFIDMRRSAIMTARLGATVLDGLTGTIDIPKQTASSAAQWVAEDSALTETDANFTDVNLAPKTVGSLTSYSRRTLINAVPAVEQLVRRDLAAVVARAIDYQAIFGDGSAGTPTGVVNASGVATSTLATPSWAEVLAMIAAIQSEDADIGSLNWAMNPAAVAKLRATNKVAAEPEHGFLMTEPGSLAGYGVGTSTAIPTTATPDTTVIFGAWPQLLIGRWSGTDILVNPYGSGYAAGRVQVRAMQDVDVAVRHGESFAVAADLAV